MPVKRKIKRGKETSKTSRNKKRRTKTRDTGSEDERTSKPTL